MYVARTASLATSYTVHVLLLFLCAVCVRAIILDFKTAACQNILVLLTENILLQSYYYCSRFLCIYCSRSTFSLKSLAAMSYQPLQQDARDSHLNPPVNYGSAGVTTTATTHTDTVLPHTRLRPSGCASGTLAGFAIVSIVLSFIAFVLNVIPVGKGIAVYQLGYKSEVLWKERLFVPGIWLGVLVSVMVRSKCS